MARGFRVWQKKRGNRRTGSRKLGLAGELLFFAVSFLLGCGGLVVLFTMLVVPEWRVNREFVRGTCTVADKRIAPRAGEDGPLYRPEIQIEYRVDGESYKIWTYDIWSLSGWYSSGLEEKQADLNRFNVGGRYECWYDPSDPRQAVLVRGYSWWVWPVLAVPLSLLLIGGAGLTYTAWTWGKSAERRAALAKRAGALDLVDGRGRSEGEFPGIPNGSKITDSPGTTLAFRLPIAASPAWSLLVLLVAATVWNGIVAVFVRIALNAYLDGKPDWLLTAFLVPCLLMGLGLVVYFFRQLLVTTGVGPTLVEISDHPLYAGKPCRMFVSQAGRLKVKSLGVSLVCEEKATYRQGTNTRSESRRVYRQPLLERTDFEIHPGAPFESECELALPAGAMHSFKSEHNEINWKIVVRGEVAGWPKYERSFPIVVYPCASGKRE